MSLLLKKVKGHSGLVLTSFLMTCLMVTSQLWQPKLLQKVMTAIMNEDNQELKSVGITLIVVAIIGLIAGILNTILAAKVAQEVASEIRADGFKKIQTFSFTDIEKFSTSN
ncbi:MAG: ABC transporter ATP-binding protein, partial [Vagococcus sp.]